MGQAEIKGPAPAKSNSPQAPTQQVSESLNDGDASLLLPGGRNIFGGGGKILVSLQGTTKTIRLQPGPPDGDNLTRAALFSMADNISPDRGAVTLKFFSKLISQNRKAANPWEAPWVFFGYKGPYNFAYIALKTSGLELGYKNGAPTNAESDKQYYRGQKIVIAETRNPTAVGAMAEWEITVSSSALTIRKNNKIVIILEPSKLKTGSPEELLVKAFYEKGLVGFYSEDAKVEISNPALK